MARSVNRPLDLASAQCYGRLAVKEAIVEFRILGPLEVVEDGHSLALAAGKQRALLAILLLRANEVVSTDDLIDGLWGDSPPATAAKSIQIYVSQLRKTLGDSRTADAGSAVLLTRGHGYELRVGQDELDLHRFERLVEEGKQALASAQPADAAPKLRDALSLWHGPPLADFTYEPFAQPEIARLEEVRLNALEDRIAADLALGRHADLIGELEALVAQHPLRERLHGQLMLALYRSGRQAEALQVYQQTRRHLHDELGLEPSQSLQALEKGILNHDRALAPPVPEAVSLLDGKKALRRPRTPIVAGAILLLAAVAAGVVELTRGSGPGGLTSVAPNSLAQIDPKTNRVVAQVGVGTQPGQIVYGSGALWVLNNGDNTVSRVDPVTRRQVRAITLGAVPAGVAARRKAIWLATDKGIKVIDPTFNDPIRTIKIRSSPATAGGPWVSSPVAIAFAHGSPWIINGDYGGIVLHVDAKTGAIVDRTQTGNTPAALSSNGGDLWVTDILDNAVSRVDGTGAVTAKVNVGRGPTGIAVGRRSVWVTDSADDDVKRVDPTNASVITTIPVGRGPTAIVIGSHAIWVANRYDGTISRIDPDSNKVTGTITIGNSPVGLAFARGSLWVTVESKPLAGSSALAEKGGLALVDWRPPSVDPATAATFSARSAQLEYATCAKLLNYPDKPAPAGSRLEPEVAESMPRVSPDGKTYTFTIRRGYRFSPPSNEPVRAATFKHTIERSLSPKFATAAVYVGDIVGEKPYVQGKARHIAGVIARGQTLTIKLNNPAGDFPTRMAMPLFCSIPTNTPIHPLNIPIPSAGPYYVASHDPGAETILKRNPNYTGPRPHHLAEIVFSSPSAFSTPLAIARVIAGETDYAPDTLFSGSWPELNRRYGARSPAAQAGHQRVFLNHWLDLDALTLNVRRPLFADVRLRRAVNFAIDRRALAAGGSFPSAGYLSSTPTDQYLIPNIPGFREVEIYPLAGDLRRARRLAGNARRAAVMYTCNFSPCLRDAQVVKKNLAALGIAVQVRAFDFDELFRRQGRKGEPYDIGLNTWRFDYPDPFDILNASFDSSLGPGYLTNVGGFSNPDWRRRLEAAERLSGGRRARAYARLDAELARKTTPWVPFGYNATLDFFSPRIGCEMYQPIYGMDLAALCIRPTQR
jgi:YVTN family beta-propeller protein